MIGTPNKFEECETKTSLREGVYVRQSGQTVLITKAEYETWKEERNQRKKNVISATPPITPWKSV